MPRPLLLEPEAKADLEQAFNWYEDQRAGLGSEFFAEVARLLTTIEQNPQSSRSFGDRPDVRLFTGFLLPYSTYSIRTRLPSLRSCTVAGTHAVGRSGADA